MVSFLFFIPFWANCDAPTPWQIGRPIFATTIAKEQFYTFYYFHIITGLFLLATIYLFYILIKNFYWNKNNTKVRISVSKSLQIQLFIAILITSIIAVIYSIGWFNPFKSDNPELAFLDIVIIGTKDGWIYVIPELGQKVKPLIQQTLSDLELGKHDLRLLSTNMPLNLPVNSVINLHVTSIESSLFWHSPSLGVNIPAKPGITSFETITTTKTGVFYGLCANYSNINNGVLSTEVIITSQENFLKWILLVFPDLVIDKSFIDYIKPCIFSPLTYWNLSTLLFFVLKAKPVFVHFFYKTFY